MMLSNQKLIALKGKSKLYKITDTDGLYLAVSPKSTKSWRYNYVLDEKQQTKTPQLLPPESMLQFQSMERETWLWRVKRQVLFLKPVQDDHGDENGGDGYADKHKIRPTQSIGPGLLNPKNF